MPRCQYILRAGTTNFYINKKGIIFLICICIGSNKLSVEELIASLLENNYVSCTITLFVDQWSNLIKTNDVIGFQYMIETRNFAKLFQIERLFIQILWQRNII